MRVHTGAGNIRDIKALVEAAQTAEAAGYDGIDTAETNHDPFVAATVVGANTERVTVATNIAVAFARSPMTTAVTANDLQLLSKGRFQLGLGSQIKPHIEKRFSMPWSGKPASQMREFISAVRAIWDCWNNGTKLNFRGDYYSHTLMTPFFEPGANPYGPPKVQLAGVGPGMTRVAGEVCDGFLSHAFTTERYLREVTLPALEEGMAKSGRTRDKFEISLPAFVVTGATEEKMAAAALGTRQQIAFYGSTLAYRPVLELHGWGELQTQLNTLSKQGKWVEMGGLIDDEVLHAFAVVAEPKDLADKLKHRWGGLVDRMSFYVPHIADEQQWSQTVRDLQAA